MPDAARYRAWMNTILNNINAASGRPDDKCLQWAMQAIDENITDEQLYNVPKAFMTLSREIMSKSQ